MLQAVMSGLCAHNMIFGENVDVVAKKAIELTNAVFAEMGKEK
jgi:hypothetical protein